MTSRVGTQISECLCSFCEKAKPLKQIFAGGNQGKTICNDCVMYVREEMGLRNKDEVLQEIMNDG